MTRATIAGLLIIGVPVMLVALMLFWRRQRAVVAFALALVTVGLGYLAITGAAGDIARTVLGPHPWIAPRTEAAKPSADTKPAEGAAKPRSAEPGSAQQGATRADSGNAKEPEPKPKPGLPGAAGPQP